MFSSKKNHKMGRTEMFATVCIVMLYDEDWAKVESNKEP